MATIQELDGHCPVTGWPPSNITWSLHIQSDMYSRLVKSLNACVQVGDGHYPGTGWPLSRNWMATIQQVDGHLPALHGSYPYSQICTAGWQRHPVKCIQVEEATVQQLDGYCPGTG